MKYEEIVLITGISGAGKNIAIRCLEDIGFFCVDNLPMTFIPDIIEKFTSIDKNITKLGFGIDIREKDFLKTFSKIMDFLETKKYKFKVLFLEAADEVLIARFSETRRKHPLGGDNQNLLAKNIAKEKKLLENIRLKADKVINTSKLSTNELKDIIKKFVTTNKTSKKNTSLMINLISFGFKFGVPIDVDMLFDVRFLPNPFYIDKIKIFTGNEKPIEEFIFSQEETGVFLKKLEDLLNFLMPQFEKEGKSYLTIAIGCTGGKHRSVAIINRLRQYFHDKNYSVGVFHRDITK